MRCMLFFESDSTGQSRNPMELTVGRLLPHLEVAASSALRQRGLTYPENWRSCPKNLLSLDIFNLATLDVFHRHVFQLDDLPNGEESIGKTRFHHLPFYVLDIWVPLDFEPTPEPERNDGGFPV